MTDTYEREDCYDNKNKHKQTNESSANLLLCGNKAGTEREQEVQLANFG